MHLIHQLGTGGAENGKINLVNNINQVSFQCAVCSMAGRGVQTGRVDQTKTAIFELNKKPGNDWLIPYRLVKIFKKWKPDIVHTHSWGTLCEGIVGAKIAGVRRIVHGEHGTIQQKKRNIIIQRLCWHLVDQVLAVSSAHRDKLAKTINFPSEKILTLMNGVDTTRFSANSFTKTELRESLQISGDSIVIGTVGRLVPVKNQKMLISAFAELLPSFPRLRLIIVGDGPLMGDLVRLTQLLDVGKNIQFLGRRSDVPQLLCAMDIFALTSDSEGMSNTILEAMSCSLPVVATETGGNPGLISNNITGKLVSVNSVDALTEALADLVKDRVKRAAFGRAGREMIEKKYSLAKMVSRYEKLYERLINP